jgi:uncharacterized protein YegL
MSDNFPPEVDDHTFDIVRFSNGAQKRTMLLFLLDTSGSMNGAENTSPRPIDELNSAVEAWAAHLHKSTDLQYRAEVAVITFGAGGVRVHKGADGAVFIPAAVFTPPALIAGGVTPMFEAIRTAIDLAERRKAELDEAGIQRFRPLIFMLTDGGPTDDSGNRVPRGEWAPVGNMLAALEAKRKLAFFAVGVSGADFECLKTLAPTANWKVSHDNLAKFLIEASNSAADDIDPFEAARRKMQSLGEKSLRATEGYDGAPDNHARRRVRAGAWPVHGRPRALLASVANRCHVGHRKRSPADPTGVPGCVPVQLCGPDLSSGLVERAARRALHREHRRRSRLRAELRGRGYSGRRHRAGRRGGRLQ